MFFFSFRQSVYLQWLDQSWKKRIEKETEGAHSNDINGIPMESLGRFGDTYC